MCVWLSQGVACFGQTPNAGKHCEKKNIPVNVYRYNSSCKMSKRDFSLTWRIKMQTLHLCRCCQLRQSAGPISNLLIGMNHFHTKTCKNTAIPLQNVRKLRSASIKSSHSPWWLLKMSFLCPWNSKIRNLLFKNASIYSQKTTEGLNLKLKRESYWVINHVKLSCHITASLRRQSLKHWLMGVKK